ncbi:unnamed protein product [Cochlearia groenlandica]
MNQELHHQHSSRNTRGAITYNSVKLLVLVCSSLVVSLYHNIITSCCCCYYVSQQDSFRHEEDAYSLYSNSENDINYRLSSIARSEELHIQQTLISYNPRLTSALRTVEAEADEWRRRCELERLENKELQRKAAEAETAKWKQKYEAERCRSQEAKHKGICTLSSHPKKVSPGLFHYAFVCLIESLMMAVAYLVTNFLIGFTTGAGFIGIIMMYSGDFRLLTDLPKIFCHYTVSYVIFGFWPVQRGYKRDLVEDYGVMDWRDLTATILAIFLCSRILFYVALTLKDIVQMIYKAIRAKFYINVQFSWR